MSDETPEARPETARAGRDKESLRSKAGTKFVEGLVGAAIAVVGAYLAAVFLTPFDFARWWHGLPDPNDFSGEWHGEVGGRPARLVIQPHDGSSEIAGGLSIDFGGTTHDIDVTGSVDSRVVITGNLDTANQLVISLERVAFERGPNERYTRLDPEEQAEAPARICPTSDDVDDFPNVEDCRPFGNGPTSFFRVTPDE